MNRLTTLLTVTALSAGALGACGLSTLARADSTTAPLTMTVFYGDLDINNVHGAAVLYERISFAAETVCRDLGRSREVNLLSRYRSCVRSALGGAIAKVNSTALTGYAAARGVVPDGAPISRGAPLALLGISSASLRSKMKVALAQMAPAN